VSVVYLAVSVSVQKESQITSVPFIVKTKLCDANATRQLLLYINQLLYRSYDFISPRKLHVSTQLCDQIRVRHDVTHYCRTTTGQTTGAIIIMRLLPCSTGTKVATGFPFRNEIYNSGGSVRVHVVCVATGKLQLISMRTFRNGGHIF
jgi:hypothetical protein